MKLKNPPIYLIVLFLVLALGCTKKSENSTDENSRPNDISANLLAAGESASDILSNDKYNKIKVEIAYVEGFRPTEAAMTEFVNFLRTHTFKEDIELVYTELASPEEETLTIDEIADLESKNRTIYSIGETLGVYIYFADAPSEDDVEEEDLVTLGAVYRNTTMVIHESAIRDIASRSIIITNADVETATINHEFGHLFGLVDLGTTPVNDHEDAEAKNHCNVERCLMRAQLQFSRANSKSSGLVSKSILKSSCSLSAMSVLKALEANSSQGAMNAVPLGVECILDIQSNGGR